MFSFLQFSSSKHSTYIDQIPTLILFSHQTLGPLSVLFPSDFFIKTLYKLEQIPTLILISHQPLGPISVLLFSDFFIKTLYTPRQSPQFNIILPSNLGSPKCSVSFKFLHQIAVEALTNFPTLILSSHQPLGPLILLFTSNFFTKPLCKS